MDDKIHGPPAAFAGGGLGGGTQERFVVRQKPHGLRYQPGGDIGRHLSAETIFEPESALTKEPPQRVAREQHVFLCVTDRDFDSLGR
jgi:hypothetical protein